MSFPHRTLLACTLGLASALLAVPRPARAQSKDLSTGLRDEDMRIIGRDPGDAAGSAIAVGDVSGDGIGDILIGSPRSSGVQNSRLNSGEVSVVLGGVTLPSTFQVRNAAHTFYGATESARLGTSVAVADLDGDGVGDIVMGAPEADAPGSGEGSSTRCSAGIAPMPGRLRARSLVAYSNASGGSSRSSESSRITSTIGSSAAIESS